MIIRFSPKLRMSKRYASDYKIAQAKRGAMDAGGFEYILEEFPLEFDCVKPLCRELPRAGSTNTSCMSQ
jgi:hypothetical protein